MCTKVVYSYMAVGVIMFQISRYWQRSTVEDHTKRIVCAVCRAPSVYSGMCYREAFMLSVMRKKGFEKAEGMNENS